MSFRKRMLRHGPRTGVLAASIGALIATGGVTSTAFGQDDEDEEESDETIVVTGTRIRRDDYSAVNATTVVTADDMRNLGVISVADMINQLPSNVASDTPFTQTDSTFNMGASIANLRGMNATSGSRTLTLVDSRRFVGSNSTGSVDLNMIPTALVGRIETVTGGSSATYGADAMAGVVNVILDNNISGVTVDMSYDTTDEGDGDNIALSIGTGFEVFDRRGQITLGYDRSNQDGIDNCVTRDICRRSMRIFANGRVVAPLFSTITPFSPLTADHYFPDLPQYVITDGFRYARVPEGYTRDNQGDPIDPNDLTQGTYRFTDDGRGIIPYLEDLTPEQRAIVIQAGEGPTGTTPFGDGVNGVRGPLAYEGVPILPETIRDNLYTRFAYDFEGGTQINASLTYGKTESTSKQASARQSYWGGYCIFPTNAFLSDEWGATQELQDLITARTTNTNPDPVTMMGGSGACRPAPYLGTSFINTTLYDFPEQGGMTGIVRDVSPQVSRLNITDTETLNFSIGANGDLFEGGSWTWDAYLQYGESERFVEVKNWASSRRMEMSLHSLWDPAVNAPVCAVNHSVEGPMWESRWLDYISSALDDDATPELTQAYFDNLSGRVNGLQPCAPYNPFGLTSSPESVAFAFPSIIDGNQNDQTSLSVTFSGDAWRGFGDAGPVRMAAGIEIRENNTDNGVPGNGYTDRDFGLNFSDDWNGKTETSEAFVEFDIPLLRDRLFADYLMANVAYRYTENTTQRIDGSVDLVTEETTRSIESWKASMVWQPFDIMRVRMTRSTDTRAPSAVELFQTNRGSLSTGANQERISVFRYDNPLTDLTDEEYDFWEQYNDGGNSQLEEETSITQTIGMVFTPTELLSGLSVSIDYYETDIKGGIDSISAGQVVQRCAMELADNNWSTEGTEFCPNIVFGQAQSGLDDFLALTEDGQPNPAYPNYVNIDSVTASSANSAPFSSRGIDISASYNTQLPGGSLLNVRVLASRALAQLVVPDGAVVTGTVGPTVDVSGQTGSQGLSSIWQWASPLFTDYSPTPRISGNAWVTWNRNAFSVTGQVRYIGSGRLNNQGVWIGPGEVGYYYDGQGQAVGPFDYSPDVSQTVTDSELPSWTTLNLNFSYDFSRSRFSFDRFDDLSVYFNIENVGDRIPDFFSGTGAGGVNTTYFNIMGRQYRMGVRMHF